MRGTAKVLLSLTLVLAAIVAVSDSIPTVPGSGDDQVVAQRYPLRKRSSNFFERSKISNSPINKTSSR